MERGQREVMAGRERRAEEVRAKRVTLREVFRGEYWIWLTIIYYFYQITHYLQSEGFPQSEHWRQLDVTTSTHCSTSQLSRHDLVIIRYCKLNIKIVLKIRKLFSYVSYRVSGSYLVFFFYHLLAWNIYHSVRVTPWGLDRAVADARDHGGLDGHEGVGASNVSWAENDIRQG